MDYLTIQHQIVRSFAAVAIAALAFGTTACEVRKTQEGELPKVQVEGGQAPKYDVEGPDVKVGQEKKEITVPDVDIVTPAEKRAGGNVEEGKVEQPAGGSTTPPAESTTPPAPTTPPAAE